MFSAQNKPIAIDFGSSCIKMIQLENGSPTKLWGAIGLRVPDEIRADKELLFGFLETQLPRLCRKGKFKGRRVVCSIPSVETFVQHMQIAPIEGPDRAELIKVQLQSQMGWPPFGMVIRTFDVTPIHRDGENLLEVICVAISRETVMRYVDLLKKCKLEVVGVHSEVMAMTRAFVDEEDHATATILYIDIGWSSTKVAIAQDGQPAFARSISLGGRHLDQKMAEQLGCDLATARAHRISEQVLAASGSPETNDADDAATSTKVMGGGDDGGMNEVVDSIADELSMCLRYHQSLFRGRKIDRVVFLGGESRNISLCQNLAKGLRLPAKLGDPLSSIAIKRGMKTPGLTLGQPQPGWAVVCGLCHSPTDL